MKKPLETLEIKDFLYKKGYEDVTYSQGHAEINMSNLGPGNVYTYTINTILNIADEYRKCEKIVKKHNSETNCDLSLRYIGGLQINLVGDNITEESDLELMIQIVNKSIK